jgi:undecaprenyl-diphosphatase
LNLLQSVVLGVVQGLTEFLPISSTAHMNVIPRLLGWGKPGTTAEAVIQLGTVVAVLVYFRQDLARVAGGFVRSLRRGGDKTAPEARQGWAILAGTLPICVAGLLFEDAIDTTLRGVRVIGVAMITLALVLWLAEVLARRTRPLSDVRVRDGWIVGLAQAMALLPGVSRSGATLTAALLLNLDREAAARFSFLLSIPAIVLSGLYKIKDVGEPADPETMHWTTPDLVVATAIAGIVGYLSIAFLISYLRKRSTLVFVAYRLVAGALILYLAQAGLLK